MFHGEIKVSDQYISQRHSSESQQRELPCGTCFAFIPTLAQGAGSGSHIFPTVSLGLFLYSALMAGGKPSPLSKVRCRSARHPSHSTWQKGRSQSQLKEVTESCRQLQLVYFVDILWSDLKIIAASVKSAMLLALWLEEVRHYFTVQDN